MSEQPHSSASAIVDALGARWEGESLENKTLLIVGDEGLGDTLNFMAQCSELKSRYHCRIVLMVHDGLVPLLQQFKYADAVVSRLEKTCPRFDFYLRISNVPIALKLFLGVSGTTVSPYLDANPDLVERWRAKLAGVTNFRVGIAWQGNTAHTQDIYRSFSVSDLYPLSKLTGVTFYSLQIGEAVTQLGDAPGHMDIVDIGSELDEESGAFVQTAAVLMNLDLVVSCDSSIHHLAGALGVPAWLALNNAPDWRWSGNSDKTVWYPHTRLFRQRHRGDWTGVFDRMATELPAQDARVRVRSAHQRKVSQVGQNRTVIGKYGYLTYNRHDAYIGRSIEKYGEWSELEVKLLLQLLKPGYTVVEAGANIGSHTLPMSKIVGTHGRVIAFEPQRAIYQILCGNMAQNSQLNVDCRHGALGAEVDVIVVPGLDYRSANNFGGLQMAHSGSGERVALLTIDGLELDELHLIKADVEGMELDVLKGAEQSIKGFRPMLYLEANDEGALTTLSEWLSPRGYRMLLHRPAIYSRHNFYQNQENVFDKLCSHNVLCYHESTNIKAISLS